MPDSIILEKSGSIAKVFFNDPATFNSFNLETIKKFADTIVTLAGDSSVKGIIISGTGKAFCTGGDLKWAHAFGQGPSAAFHELSSRFHQAVTEIRNMKKPVVAAINGIAAGGGFSLALACDFRIMAKSAVLKQGFTSNGLSMDGGGTWTLPRLVGVARAMEILALDEPVAADKALAYGLVNRLTEAHELIPESEKLVAGILQKSLFSFGWSKRLLNDSFHASFESQLEQERAALSGCAGHRDGREGIQAFIEKRKPEFSS